MQTRISAFWTFLIVIFIVDLSMAYSQEYERLTPAEGERCLICDKPLTSEDVTLSVRGRRVPLKQMMVDSFMNNQARYFGRMQPKGALFQEDMSGPPGTALGGTNPGWFIFGLYVLTGLLFGALSGYAAVSKGLDAIPHFATGFLLNIFGYIYVKSRPKQEFAGDIPQGFSKITTTSEPVLCTKCDYSNHPAASVCLGCGAELVPSEISEVHRIS